MLLLLLFVSTSAHLIQNRVDYPIAITNEKQCNELLQPGQDVEIDVTPGDVVRIKNNLGMNLGNMLIWPGAHNSTLIDTDFRSAQRCQDVSPNCSPNQCLHGTGWMVVHCARTCNSCHLQKRSKRCNATQLGMTETSMIPGFLERTVQNGLENYHGKLLNSDPPILLFDNFVSDDDIEELLYFAIGADLQRSTGQGDIDENGVQEQKEIWDRTSSNAWCGGDCERLGAMKRLKAKTSTLMAVPEKNFESAQILRYQETEFYATHNDVGELDFEAVAGPRIFTLFVYLNDVAEGGETDFPKLNIAVQPKRGSAVLWSSVKEDHSGNFSKDGRTDHQAKPLPPGGLKFGMNLWVHARAFSVANVWGCSGSFS